MLLTKSKINRPGYECTKYFPQKRVVKFRSRSRPRPRVIKVPYVLL